jgi:hypothetical protein
MQYPTVSLHSYQRFINEFRQNSPLRDKPEGVLRGQGEDPLNRVRPELLRLIDDWKKTIKKIGDSSAKKEELEGELSSQLFRVLESLPVTMLTDSDFWRYISSEYFFEFTLWRDGQACALASFGASSSSVNFDCVPFRMFNRGLIAFTITEDINDLDYAHIPGTDLWRSHILRVLTSYSASMSQAILDEYKKGNLPTAVVRDVAKSLRKSRANIVFEVLDLDQSAEILTREISKTLASLNR